MTRKISCSISLWATGAFIALAGALSAATVTADQAKTAVQRWLSDDPALGCPIQGTVGEVRTCTPANGASFHVVKLATGGFVVTSADTRRAPVVAFSSGADLVEDDANPLWVLLKRDLAIRTQGESSGGGAQLMGAAPSEVETANEAKWAKLLGGGAQLMSAQGISSVSDVRVAPFVQSKWNQGTVGNGKCYNYYTPSNYVCGCVATAGAQIMRYFCYPTAAMPQFTNPNCAVNGTATTLTTKGGTYDWGQMPLVPDSSMTGAQRKAIGKLTSDVGICCNMDYASDGSSAGGYMLAYALTTYFGYSSAQLAQWNQNTDKSGSEYTRNALLSNFDAGLPVALSLNGVDGGHEVVGDGYGYSDGTLYIHFNMGWEGFDDAWYAPPAMSTTQYDFSILNGFVYNISPNLPGNIVIYSGRVLDANGVPVEGATVAFSEVHSPLSGIEGAGMIGYVQTNAKGIYSLPLVPGDYILNAFHGDSHAELSAQVAANVVTPMVLPDSFSYSPTPKVNNRWGVDFVLSDVASVAVPQFTPPSCLFYPSTNVTISCATAGATIRYTLDGSDPTESSAPYTGVITVSDDTVIKARAWKSGMNPSVIVTSTYTYDAAQGAPKGDYFDNPIVITGTSGSRTIDDNAPYTVEPGEPWHTQRPSDDPRYTYTYNYQYHTIWYKWTAPGSGTMTFKTRMPHYYGGTYVAVYTGETLSSIERLAFSIEDNPSDDYRTSVSVNVTQGETYRIVGMSCGEQYTDQFVLDWSGNLTVVSTETSTTEVPVPYTWLDGYFAGQGTSAQAYENLANADQDNDGFTTWQEYLAGTDPTSAASQLKATIRMEGSTPVVEWNTTNSNLNALGYRYVPKGKSSLTAAGDWQPAATGHRFFKVFIEPVQ